MPWVYGPSTDMNEHTWHRYESVVYDKDADVIIAAGYTNFYGEYIPESTSGSGSSGGSEGSKRLLEE